MNIISGGVCAAKGFKATASIAESVRINQKEIFLLFIAKSVQQQPQFTQPIL